MSTIIKALLLCPLARADYCVNGFCYPDATSLLQTAQRVTAGAARGGNMQQSMMGDVSQPMMGGMPPNPMMGGMPNPMMGGMQLPGMPNPMMGRMPPMPGMPNPMMGGMPNPMMGGMPNPMMGGMPNPMMGGMPNPMMGGMPTGPMPGFAPPQLHQVPPQSLLDLGANPQKKPVQPDLEASRSLVHQWTLDPKARKPAVVPGQSPLRKPASSANKPAPPAYAAAYPAAPSFAAAAGLPKFPKAPSGGIILGSTGYEVPVLNPFPATNPWPGPLMAPPPLLPQEPVLDPFDKVAIAKKDKDWAKNVKIAAVMQTAEAYQSVGIAGRDLAWAKAEVNFAERGLKDAAKTKNPVLLQEAESQLIAADKDLDWANAQKAASRISQGKAIFEAAIAARDNLWAKIEVRTAKEGAKRQKKWQKEWAKAEKEAAKQR